MSTIFARQPRRVHATAALLFLLVIVALLLVGGQRSAQATGATLFIYDDDLASGWQVEESGTKVQLNNNSPTYSGSHSMRVNFGNGKVHFRLERTDVLSAASSLRFALHGEEQGREVLITVLDGQGRPIVETQTVPLPVGSWSLVEISLEDVAAGSAIGAIHVEKAGGGRPWSHFYIDEMSLLGVETSATATPTPTTEPSATPTDEPVEPTPTATAIDEPEPTPTDEPQATATDEAEPTPTDEPDPSATQELTPTATSEPQPTSAPVQSGGIWISAAEIDNLPTSGNAWENVLDWAQKSAGSPDIGDQNDQTDAAVVARALVYARTGDAQYRDEAVTAIMKAMGTESGAGILAVARNLAGYVVAADLVGLDGADDDVFRTWLDTVRFQVFDGAGPALSIASCHEQRPNNFGTHCGTSRLAAALYLGDEAEVQRAATVFRGWLGDRSAYAGFKFGSDMSWHCDPDRPVGINPANCTIEGHNVDGVLPDDQRRGGSFTWPPPAENYVWEALQGAVAQARILDRQGYNVFSWSDDALLRAVDWLHAEANYPADGDDTGTPWLINGEYNTNYPATSGGARPGKNGLGFYDWLYGG